MSEFNQNVHRSDSHADRIRFACKYCGSENITADAAACWDFDRQEWVVTNVSDKGHSCDDCDGETTIIEVVS